MTTYFDKTEKGREEIATRKYQLGLRLRSLLLLIDGRHSAGEILGKLQGAGFNEQSFAELLEQGYIRHVASTPPQGDSTQEVRDAEPDVPREETASDTVPSGGESQYQSLYHFYTETIKSTLGLRGYALQLKVERAGSIEDFRALRDPYLKAVEKMKGLEMARSLRDRLDRLLRNDGSDAARGQSGMQSRSEPVS